MKRPLSHVLALTLIIAALVTPASAAPLAGPCSPSMTYDPACDVNHDNVVDVLDIQLTAGHWNQTGTWTGGDGWALTGNAGTSPATNFVGTTDGQDLIVQPGAGRVGVGTTTPTNGKLQVDGGSELGLYATSTAAEAVLGEAATSYLAGVRGTNSAFDSIGVLGEADAAGSIGVWGQSAANTGVFGLSTDGVAVWGQSTNGTAVRAESTNNYGLYVDAPGNTAIRVNSAGITAVSVASAGNAGFGVNTAGATGLYVGSAGYYGVWVNSAGYYGILAAGSQYAGWFNGAIRVNGGCTGCLLANFAVNAGDRALQPGDVVSIQSATSTDFDTGPSLWHVTQAQPGRAVVGVVAGRAELVIQKEHHPGTTGQVLVPRQGAAQPGEYISVIYNGPMQVKAAGPVAAGERLTVDADGNARGLRKTEVNGVPVAEDAPVLGIALSAPANGLVWVLINPQ